MTSLAVFRHAIRLISILIGVAALTACGGDGGTSSNAGHTFSGSVGDGPVVGATVVIRDAHGAVLGTTTSDERAHYRLSVDSGVAYPVTLTATGGTDLVSGVAPSFTLVSLVSGPTITTANINPFTSLIVQSAQRMPGGANDVNLNQARANVLAALNVGVDTAAFPDPLYTEVTGSNIAVVVKATEVLSEVVRRAADALLIRGNVVSTDGLIKALAADLVDGTLDGAGADGADPLVAATTTIASAQVLVEALSNTLRVNGADAAPYMDNAIRTAVPDAPSGARIANVKVTRSLLEQLQGAVAAARTLGTTSELETLYNIVSDLPSDSLPADISAAIPQGAGSTLGGVLTQVALASDSQLQTVNSVASGHMPTVPPTDTALAALEVSTRADRSSPSDLSGASLHGQVYVFLPESAGIHVVRFFVDDPGISGTPSNNEMSAPYDLMGTTSGGDAAPFDTTLLSNGEHSVSAEIEQTDGSTSVTTASFNVNNQQSTGGGSSGGSSGGSASGSSSGSTSGSSSGSTGGSSSGSTGGSSSGSTGGSTGGSAGNTSGGSSGGTTPSTGGENGGSGTGTANSVPAANNDTAHTERDTAVTVQVLANDTGLGDSPVIVAVASAPAHGNTSVLSDNRVRYVPTAGYVGSDSLVYRITDANGDVAVATVNIEVTCSTCRFGVDLALSWNPNTDAISGYRVYYGTSAGAVDTLVADLALNSGLFDPLAPTLAFNSATKLGLYAGDTVCFRIAAYNSAGDSPLSSAVCGGL